jgi:hypothetical protein
VATIDRATMETWIQRVFELNATYENLIGIRSDQRLGPPAPEAEIARLEASLGFLLPPSYRLFLSLHDGWTSFQANFSLLSIAEQLAGEARDYIRSWKAKGWAGGEPLLIDGLVIGVELHEAKGYIIDTARRSDRDEMDIVYWVFFETERYPDFLAMLQRKAQYMEEFIAEERGTGS